MRVVSQDFLDALPGSHPPVVRCDVWRAGQLLGQDLPVSGGSVTVTAGQAVRSSVSVDITDPDGQWVPRSSSDALAPFGSELHIRAGIRLGNRVELVSLGWFPIMTVDVIEDYAEYVRPAEPGRVYRVQRGATTPLNAVDRATVVQASRFLTVTQPTQPTVLSEIGYLLSGVAPWQPPNIPDMGITPSSVTYQDDRLGAVQALADLMGMDFIFDGDGFGALITQGFSTPVWDITTGPGGVQSAMSKSLKRDGIYNAVVFRGTADDSLPVQGIAVIADGPLRWDGPLGRVPFFASSPLLSAQSSVDQAAVTRLSTLRAKQSQEISVTCICNYALEVGDTVTLTMRRGKIPARITKAEYPLLPGPMTLTVVADPDLLAAVS